MLSAKRAFVDMDGLLADYYGGIIRALHDGLFDSHPSFSTPAWPYICRLGDWDFYDNSPLYLSSSLVAPVMGHAFYANLDWLPDGRKILAAVEEAFGKENVYLLSSPWDTEGCESGKRKWIKKHIPEYQKRTLIGTCKEACGFSNAILFDDSAENCKKFVKAGGEDAILIPRPWNELFAQCSLNDGAVLDNHFELMLDSFWPRTVLPRE